MENRNRKNQFKDTLRKAESVFEIVFLSVEFYLLWRHFYSYENFPHYHSMGKYVLMLVYAVFVFFAFYLNDGFKFGQLKFTDEAVSQIISVLIVDVITYFQLSLIADRLIKVYPMLILFGIDIIICFGLCYIFTFIYHEVFTPKNMIMIYGSESAVALKFKMDKRRDKYCVNTLISIDEDVDYIKSQIDKHDAVIINDVPAEKRNDILKYCFGKDIRTYAVPKISDVIIRGSYDITLFDTPLLLMNSGGLSPFKRLIKRIFDIIASGLAIVLLSPVFAVIAIAIKAEDHGPVFYKQERVTIGGKIFKIIKFRSMIVNAEAQGKAILATDHDPRITKIGRFIRATRIDELPQIINIFLGDMSIVGPRPERPELIEQYCLEIPEFVYRQKVKGGLTGYAQIYGKYNTSSYDKLRLDLMYIENYTFLLDIKLIVMTVRIMLKKESTEGADASRELEEQIKAYFAQLKENKNDSKD